MAEPRSGRRTTVAVALAGLAIVAGLAVWWWLRPGSRADGPIILISIDTLRADRLPVYGYTKVQTPAIDRLAADAVVFDRAYAHSPQTLPSHASILTGRLPFETGVRDNVGFTVRRDQPTLASLLHERGFATGGVVSAFVLRKETGIDRGFDFFDSALPPSAPDMPMGQVQRAGLDSLEVATRWAESLTSPRFFLFLHTYEPHTPYAPPPRYAHYAPYDGEVAYSDEVVGRLVAWLQARGLYDRATIVFLSDHGEGLGDHGELEHGLFLYDSTIRVPLIVKLPGSRSAGRRVKTQVQHIDLLPTLLEWTGAPAPSWARGRSLVPLIEGRTTAADGSAVYAEAFYGRYHFGWSELYSLTDVRYRYIKAPRPELYDLERDPRELQNLASERPQAVSAARGVLEGLLAGAHVQTPGQVSREDLQRLQALGYVGSHVSVPADRPGESLPDPKDKAGILASYRRAIELDARREYDAAIALLRTVLDDSPAMKDAWIQLGVDLVRAGRHAEAVEAFRHLVEVDPADANSYVSVAGALLTLGRYDEAQAHAEMGLGKVLPGDDRTRWSACEALVRIALARRDAAAARRYAAMTGQTSTPLESFTEGVILHGERRYAEALAQLRETARRLQGQSFTIQELYFYTGDSLANLGQSAEAVAAFREELRTAPHHLRTRASLAMLYRADGRPAEAERELADMVAMIPTPEGYAMAARTWGIFGEHARAAALRAESDRRFASRSSAPRAR